MNTLRRLRQTFFYSLACCSLFVINTSAQEYLLIIDDLEGVRISDFPGTTDISPFFSDWIRNNSVSFSFRQNPIFNPLGDLRIVSFARLFNDRNDMIAESDRNISSQFQLRRFSTGAERYTFDNTNQINFMRTPASGEGALRFNPPYTENSRLPGGNYRLAVTLYEHVPGAPSGLGRQLAEEFVQDFTLIADDQDLLLEVLVYESSPYFSDWQRNPNPAEVRVENYWHREYRVYMDARIDDERGWIAQTREDAGKLLAPIVIPAVEEYTIPGRDIPFFDPRLDPAVRNDLLEFRADVADYRRAGRFPEGQSYQLCVQLRTFADDVVHGLYRCSDRFRIDFPPAPELRFPEDRSNTVNIPTFQWDHDLSPVLVPNTRYRLQIKATPGSGDVIPDIFNRMDLVNDIQYEGINARSQEISLDDRRKLVLGQRYAWRVQAYTEMIDPPIRFQNEGSSEVWTFVYGYERIPAPRLESPSNGSTVSLPQTLEWSDVQLHDGSSARYVIKIKEIAAGTIPSQDFLEQSEGVENTNVDGSQLSLPDAHFHIEQGRTYAWQVRAFDPGGREENVFENNGLSELWTFTVRQAGGGEALSILLSYPSDNVRIADEQPPFVADPLIDRNGNKRITLTIEELERSDGGAPSEPRVFSSLGTLTERDAMLFLNSYGQGGAVPAGQPFFAPSWSVTPGNRYRWTLEIAPEQGEGQTYRQSAEFIAAPRADMLSPADGQEINPANTQLRFRVLRPTIDLGAGHGVFAPGNPPSVAGPHYVMNPVIRSIVANDSVIRYQAHHDLVFGAAIGSPFQQAEDFPRLPDGRYRWIVNTKFGDRIVATTDEEEFTITGSGLPCSAPCVCVEGIFPENSEAPAPDQLVPFNGEGRFSIGFRPLVNAEGIIGGTIRVWIRQGLEGHAVTEARGPDFIGNFTRDNLTARGDAAELSAYDVDLRNEAGEHLRLLPATNYMWRIDVNFDPARVRRDGMTCLENLTSTQSIQLFFSTMSEVECSAPCVCVSPVSPAPNAAGVEPGEDAEFTVRLDPPVNEDALRRGTIYIWSRHGNETEEETSRRDPVFIGTFTSFSRVESPFLATQFRVNPENAQGNGFTFEQGQSYLWTAEVEYNPNSVRQDGELCFESHDHARSDSVFFSVRSRPPEVECNPPIVNRNHPAAGLPLPNEVRIGGYTMTFDRNNCRMHDDGRITGSEGRTLGTGTVQAPEGNWAVEFTELEINSDNEVVNGRATAQIRNDIPVPIQQALTTGAGLTSDQVRSLNQLWHNGGTLLESIVGEKRVPIGYTLDADFAQIAALGGWGIKAAITHISFEPTLANCDIAVGLRAPIATNEGEESQWIGLYAQDIPRCLAPGARWRIALRLLGDMDFGAPNMNDWEFFIKHSEREEMPLDYTLEPGDGTAMVISERGVEQVHIEAGIRVPRSILIPQQETADRSGSWQDVPNEQVELNGTFDYTREGRELSDGNNRPPTQMGGGLYFITDLPRSRIAGKNMSITARECVIDQSSTWSPQAGAGAIYSLPGLGVGALPTHGAGFNRPPDWEGFFIKEGVLDAPPLGIPIGIRNAYSSSPLSFTAFAAPYEEVRIGETFTARLDTIDFEIDRGNFVRARIVTSMTFPGAMEGRVGLDFVYQNIPEDGNHHEADAFIASMNAREDERFRITDYISFTIRRGSQLNVTYTDPPLRPRGSKWGFIMDISGGLKFNKRNDRGDDVVSIGGIDFEHFRFATDGRGVEAPRITFFGIEIPSDSSEGSGAGEPRGNDAERKRQVVGGFPIGLRSLDVTFGNDGFSMGMEGVLTLALTGEPPEGEHGGPVFGGSIGFALDGMLEEHDGHLRWQAPTFRLTSLGIDFQSSALTIQGEVAFYDNDRIWGTGFSGEVHVEMAKLFSADAAIRFGSRDDFRYWFVKADLTTAVPIVTIGPVGVYGFIGGAYQHMQVSESRNASGVVTDVNYTPSADNTFGIMAGVHIGLAAKPSTFHAKILLTARFRDANLTNISLDGKGWFMCDLERECNGRDDSWLEVHLGFDFPESRFHASLAGQIVMNPLLRIDAPAGSMDILFEPGNWHVYVGRGPFDGPESSVISATFFPDFARIRADSYFMAGNNIDVNIRGIPIRGGGFAAGVRVQIDIGGKFLIFYGRVWGNFRAELAVISIDEAGTTCISGANGWYAIANLNLGLGLEVGIDVDLWIISGRFEIFSAEMGIDILLGGPNPTFVDGDARGSYRILDGLISGSFHYHLHVGDDVPRDCLTEAIDAQYRMPEPIVSVSPPEGQRNVSVFTTIGLGFALPEHSEITVRRDGNPVRARFRILQPLDVRPAGGRIVAGGLSISPDGLSAEWTTQDILRERTEYTVTAIAIAEERTGGIWRETRRQTKRWIFRTGDRPRDVYDPSILSYTYPLKEQRFSYIRGHDGKQYVHLKRNTDYLFTHMAPTQYLIAQYTNQNNEKQEVTLRYEPYRAACGAFLVVDNPPLEANTIYHLRFIKRTDPDRNRNAGNRLLVENIVESMSGYRQVSAYEIQRARRFVLESGGDLQRFETGAGSYLVERKEGNANSRVIQRGRIIDSVMYDWFFGVGNYETPVDKFSAMSTTYRSRSGGFISFSLSSPEPVDDDLSASVFIRKRRASTTTSVNDWFEHVVENDKLARDYDYLVSLIGRSDASVVRDFVLTTDSRLSMNTLTYIDAMAPWNFNGTNYSHYRLNAWEMEFEIMAPQSEGGGLPLQQGGFRAGNFQMGGGGRANIPHQITEYSDDMLIFPMNATMDFNSMMWRYRNVLHESIERGLVEWPVILSISFESGMKLRETGDREWQRQPSGGFHLGILCKPPDWRSQSYTEGTMNGQIEDTRRLDRISEFGRASVIGFGEMNCGESGTIPFIVLSLSIP